MYLQDIQTLKMRNGAYSASIMQAPLLHGAKLHQLPPGSPIACFPTDCFPAAPREWVKGKGSYIVKVKPNVGLWFDWRECLCNTAVLPSIKSVNPITGMKIEDLALYQYRKKCPVHNKKLNNQNYCDDCGYEIPYQNYVCGSAQTLWWDGWRQPDGSVRQFYFTEDNQKDIASILVGKENTVPAFGFAFYECIKPLNQIFVTPYYVDPIPYYVHYKRSTYYHNDNWITTSSSSSSDGSIKRSISKSMVDTAYYANSLDRNNTLSCTNSANFSASASKNYSNDDADEEVFGFEDDDMRSCVRDVSVGAGSAIDQKLLQDSYSISDYSEQPKAIIRMYLVFEDQFDSILRNGGLVEYKEKGQGFLSSVEVGV